MSHSEPASRLHLYLLGPPRAILNGKRVTGFRSSKAQALLCFLAATGSSQRRATLTALLWGDADERQASASLRNVLSNLRALVGDHLIVTRETVATDRETLWSDVAQFDALLRRTGDPGTDILQMEAAVSLYGSDFLEGFHVPDAPQFEQWATIERERLRQAVLNSLLTLADWHSGQEDFASGLEDLTRLLSIDPANEAGHRQKMTLLARLGQRSAALQQYDACRRILAEELGVEPSPETTAVHELILAGALAAPAQTRREAPRGETPAPASPPPPKPPSLDQRDMPERTAFHGRREDLAQLVKWVVTEGVRLVAISGMGGIGKTTLAVELVEHLGPGSFERVIWRSLVNAPPLELVLNAWLQTMAGQSLDRPPESIGQKLSLLFEELQRQRCLLILDNLESIIAPGEQAGRFRAGYEEYGRLIDRVGRTRHRSCLLLTTRDLPKGIRTLEEDSPRVRILPLEGLPPAPAVRLLRDRGVSAPDAALETLAEHYSGNPLALKLVADTVRDLFGNDVDAFLGGEAPVFDDIRSVLDEQYGRLSEWGREILTWLAIERSPVTIQALWENLARPPRRSQFLEAVRSLQNSSLVEVIAGDTGNNGARLTLQNVVLEYLTERLVGTLNSEIESGHPAWLHRFALVKAQCREHVQASQRRVLLEPVARSLVASRGRHDTVTHLHDLLVHLREQAAHAPGYAAANLLHLLLHLEVNLAGWDFSRLAIRQADLRTDRLAGVDLRGTDLRECAFSETFGLVKALAFSPDGRYLAAGESEGSVFLWQLAGWQPYLVLKAHRQSVSSVVFSPDGAVLASGGFDGRVCLWSVASGALLAESHPHTDTVGGITLGPGGALVASGGADHQIVLWDWRSGETRRLQERAAVNGVAFSPDGGLLASARDDKEIGIWDWRSGTLVGTLRGQTDKVRSVAFHPSGTLVATGGEDKRICLWQLDHSQAARTLDGHAGWVWALAFSPDGGSLASASTDRTIRLWDVATGQIRRTLIGHAGWADAVAYGPDGMTVASGGYDQTIRLWAADSGVALHTFRSYQRRIDRVSFSPDGTLLVSSSLNGPLQLWDVRSQCHLHKLTGHRGAIRALAISSDNGSIAGGSDDHHVYVWDVKTGELRQVLVGHTDLVRYIAFSPDGQYVFSSSYDATLRIWDPATGQVRHVIPGANAKIQIAHWLTPDGLLLAYGSNDGRVRLSNLNTGDILEHLPVAEEIPVVVVFSPQGQLLACGTDSGALWIWQMSETSTSGHIRLRFRVQPAALAIWRICFSPDGQHLAICYDGGTIRVLDTTTGESVYALSNTGGAFNLAFGGTGKYLAAAGAGNTILIFDTSTGETLRTLRGHLAEVTSLDAPADMDLLASSSADGSVRLWSLESGECLATLVADGPYAGMQICGATGITAAQRAALIALGALED